MSVRMCAWRSSNGGLPTFLSDWFGTGALPWKASGSASVKAIAGAPIERLGQAREEAGAVVARTVDRLPELDAVLGLEVTARQVVGAGEGHEGRLALLVEHADRVAHRRGERPVRVERQGPGRCGRIGPRDREGRARLVVVAARIRDQQVGRVIAAAQEHEQEARPARGRGVQTRSRPARSRRRRQPSLSIWRRFMASIPHS